MSLHQCLTCDTSYNFCPHCNPDAPSWRMLFDTEDCSIIFRTLSNYNAKLISKKDVETIFASYITTDFSRFNTAIREQLEEIFLGENAEIPLAENEIINTKSDDVDIINEFNESALTKKKTKNFYSKSNSKKNKYYVKEKSKTVK